MKEIEIVFTRSKKRFPIGSWLIRLWTWKPYSHVARKMQIGFLDKPNYFQANEGKVNWEYQDHFEKKHKVVKTMKFQCSEKQHRLFNKTCWEQVGDSYGTMQNIGIFLVDIASFFGIKMTNPWKKGMNCSEVLYRTILKPKFGDMGYNPDTIKPHHIEKILEKHRAK
jgi:hypothetical protein